ncbi:MAG: histidinol-phosphate aminotransferase family protein [Phaeodactylibacter sp.]|nr:histidinol-phosphate aminotransferase family protein [Phaeodactylibacter sp.]
MPQLNRRDWLRLAGLGGIATLGSSFPTLARPMAEPPMPDWFGDDVKIRLSSNENPFAPSKAVREAMVEAFDLACRYPNRHWQQLIDLLAEKEGVQPENIVVTCGSREGLQISGAMYARDGGEIITAAPTYSAMTSYAARWGASVNAVPLNDKLELDIQTMEEQVNEKTRLIFVCNPNNPTGTLLHPDAMEGFCRRASDKAIVFADEAYFDYVTTPDYPSMVKLVKEGKQVIVSRTFSKVYGLAGVRIGYLIAPAAIAEELRYRVVGGLNMLAVYAGVAALQDEEFKAYSLQQNADARQYVYELCDALGLEYIPSHANFVFFKTGKPINRLIEYFREEGIAIGRPFPPLLDWCRISTGRMEDMEAFGKVLKKVLG